MISSISFCILPQVFSARSSKLFLINLLSGTKADAIKKKEYDTN